MTAINELMEIDIYKSRIGKFQLSPLNTIAITVNNDTISEHGYFLRNFLVSCNSIGITWYQHPKSLLINTIIIAVETI